ncbi:MAG: DUF2298 domain-containing protein [Chloroflexia bacterium]
MRLLQKNWIPLVLSLVMIIAAFMRLYDVNFDQNTHQHPDERAITDWTINRVNLPPNTTLAQLLDPVHSPLNPRRPTEGQPLGSDMHYGAMWLYIVKTVAVEGSQLFHKPEWLTYDGLPLVGRAVSGIFDLVTVFLVFLIGRRLYGKHAGLLAAVFSAFAVTQIQISHFYIAEPYLVTFLTAALYFSVVLMQNRRAWAAALAGLFLGFALACKVSVAPVALLIVAALVLRVAYRAHTRRLGPPTELDDPHGLEPAKPEERASSVWAAARRAFALLVLAGVTTIVGATVGDPYGVLDSGLHISFDAGESIPGTTFFTLGPMHLVAEQGKYLFQLGQEAAIQRGIADVPFTRQYIGTVPVLYHFQQLVEWGMGPASGVPAVIALLLAIFLAVRRRRAAEILLLSGMIPYFLTIVTLEAKWMRYMLPLVPYMCVLAGGLLARGLYWSAAIRPRIAEWRAARRRTVPFGWRARRFAFPLITAVAVLGSLAWATAFMNIYTHEESRVIASRWLARNLPPNASIGHETWDDNLPLNMPGSPLPPLRDVSMGLYDDRPGPDELTYIKGLLDQADYIVLASNRLYASIPRLPWRYPVQMRYYDLLMSGKLGYTQILPEAYQKVYPEIFGIKINDDHADESFTVYDHPRVLVYKKTRALSQEDLQTLFGASVNQPSIPIRRPVIRTAKDYDKSLMLAQPAGQQLALGDFAWNPLADNQWVAVLLWLLAIEVIGLLAWPLTAIVCRRLPDRGYPLSKTLGLVLVAWVTWMLASLHWVPFTVYTILGAIALLGIVGVVMWRRFAPELREYISSHRGLILAWEGLFLVAFAAFLVIRILDPDLWQPFQGGEKPMEFGFLNAVLRSPWMPPGDPFFSSGTVNYYYYGYFLIGTMIKLIGVQPAIGFNLATPLLYGLTILGASSIVYNCVAVVQRARGGRGVSWAGFGWGVVGAALLAVIGNLQFLLQFISIHGWQTALVNFLGKLGPVDANLRHVYTGFNYWDASRVIDGGLTINEFPYWSFLFADLHPHLIDISVSLLALGLIFNLALGAWRWPVFRSLPAYFTTASVPTVPSPGAFARPKRDLYTTALQAGHRLWGSSPADGLLRFGTLSLVLGTLFAVNSWDFPVYVMVIGGALVLLVLTALRDRTARIYAVRLGIVGAAVVGMALAAGTAIVFYSPFLLNFKPFYNQIKIITPDMGHTPFLPFLVMWGLFLFVGFSYLGLRLWHYPWAEAAGDWRRWLLPSGPKLSPVPAAAAPLPAPAPASGTAVPVAANGAGEMGRFYSTLPVPAGAAVPVGVAQAEANGSNGANVHHTAITAPLPQPVAAGAPDDEDDYGLADVGDLGFSLEAELASRRRAWMTTLDDPEASNLGAHSAEADGYSGVAEPNGYEETSIAEAEDGNGFHWLSEEPEPVSDAADRPAAQEPDEATAPTETVPPASVLLPVPAERSRRGLLPTGFGLPMMALALLVAFVLYLQPLAANSPPHNLLDGLLALLIGGLITTLLCGVKSPGTVFGGIMLVAGFVIMLGVEYIYLADHMGDGDYYRMNTVFKFYEQAWVLVACGAAVALYALLGPRGSRRRPARRSWFSPWRALWLVPFALLVVGSLIFTVSGTQSRVADRFPTEESRPPVGTLNGMDWMDKAILNLSLDNGNITGTLPFRFEREALDWMNTHIKGTPVIAEAPLGYYRESGMMVGTYTGLPIVVGGLHQEEQRYDWQVGERRGDMTNFYRTEDISTTLLLINKYDIAYIYLGQLEQVYYQKTPAGLAKFKQMENKYLDIAYQNDVVTIYHVRPTEVAQNIGSAPGSPGTPSAPHPKPTPPPLVEDQQLRTLLATVKADPNNVDAHRALGEYYHQHQALDLAIKEFITVTQLAPKDVPAYHQLGDIYMENADPDKALAAWEQAVQQAGDADKPAAYNKVGIAYKDRGRYEDAITAFKNAVAASPHFAEAWFHLGEVYETTQDLDHARDAFQNCIKNAPQDESGKGWAADAQKQLDSLH